jgi:hypothetical protein
MFLNILEMIVVFGTLKSPSHNEFNLYFNHSKHLYFLKHQSCNIPKFQIYDTNTL